MRGTGASRRRQLPRAVALLLACPSFALAQVYAGVGDSGAVVLSNFLSNETPVELIAGPRVEPPAPPGTVAERPSLQAVGAIVQQVAHQVDVPPQLLHAVIAVESAYDARAVSPKGAQGLMQLMPATAQRFGVSDPFDPRDNVLGGARYLKWLLEQFNGDLQLVLAAYNAGENAVIRHGYRVPPFAETRSYVPKVLARMQRAARG